ncbi:MAG: T9SS type A sorting domain-containing protein [Bacteroidota bacterium]|nr:T9SS type A sorting domain-containing protein [Bacteroidota bacterium]
MKKRILPFILSTVFVGFCFFFSPLASQAGNPGSTGVDRLYQIRCNQVTGVVDPRDVLNAMEQIQKMNTKVTNSGLNLNWNEMGPVNYSGRTRALIFDNQDASGATLYAGGVSGGLWKSTNYGLTWNQINTESGEVLRVTSLTQTPTGVIYAATGESYCSQNQSVGTGIYRSDDGNTFTVISSTVPSANNSTVDWAYIQKIVCNKSGRLFAGTNKGLKYSDDGNTWTNLINGFVQDIAVGSDGTVLASVDNSIYIATSGAISNFVNLSTGAANLLPTSNVIEGSSLAIAPSDPNVMYVALADMAGNLYNLYSSIDKGANWSVIMPANSTYEPFKTEGCYANVMAVYPNDPYQILLGGANMWWGKRYDTTGYYNWEQVSFGAIESSNEQYLPLYHHVYLFRPNTDNQFAVATDNGVYTGTISTDGITYLPKSKNLSTTQFNSVAVSMYKDAVLGGGVSVGSQLIGSASQNDAKDGTQIWYESGAGNDGGTGGDCAWSLILPKVVMFSKSLNDPPFVRSEDLGSTTSPTFLGSITNTTYSFVPMHLYESFDYPYTPDVSKYIAKDSTIHAGDILTLYSNNGKFPFHYTAPSTILEGDSIEVPDPIQARLFIHGILDGNWGIYMTRDALKFSKNPEWYRVAAIPTGEQVTCMASSSDMNYLWVGTKTGNLYRISNLALATDSATADLSSPTCIVATEKFANTNFTGRYITSISIAKDNSQTVMVTLGNYGNDKYVYLTANGLDSLPQFHSIQGNLPKMPVYSSVMEMSNHNKVIIGTDFGIYSTSDVSSSSPSWSSDQNGIGNVAVTMLKQQTQQGVYYHRMQNYGDIYAATYGRGIFMDTTYYTPLGISPVSGNNLSTASLNVRPNPVKEILTVNYTMGSASNAVIMISDLSGRTCLSKSLGHQSTGDHQINLNVNSLASGSYIVRMTSASGSAFAKIIKID